MPENETYRTFISDDGRRYVRVGDLQLLKEHLLTLRGSGFDCKALNALEESVQRIESTLLLLLDEVQKSLPPIPHSSD
ncbi:MAG TPA: hypothetical protein VMW69_02985 [Spirochaetia bacterium]|nr:hypothetical protein [Spirochaetia bacterium]